MRVDRIPGGGASAAIRTIAAALAAASSLAGPVSAALADDLTARARVHVPMSQGIGSPAQDTTAPRVERSGRIEYVTGGVGDEAQRRIQAVGRQFNLAVTFARPPGDFLAGVNLAVRDQSGKTLLETGTRGRLFYADLPPGRYTVAESAPGAPEQTRTVQVALGGQQTVNFSIATGASARARWNTP